MSYVVSAPSAGGTPVLVLQRSRSVSEERPARSRYFAPVGPPVIEATSELGLRLSLTLSRGAIWPTYTTPDGQVVGVTLAEKHQTRELKETTDGLQFQRTFLVHGTNDPAACKDVGPHVGDQDDVLTDFYVEERVARPYAAGGGAGGEANIVIIVCTYSQPGSPSSGSAGTDPTYGYEFNAESEHVDKAIAQVHYGGDAERIGDLINVTDDEVQGVEINAPVVDLTEEHVFTEAEFNPAFRRALVEHTQKTNSTTFREWDVGEVLFMGASARKQAKRWYVTFTFRIRRNVDNLAITVYDTRGNAQPQSVVKRGHQYLWIESIRLPFSNGNKIKQVPHAVHVATVYDELDFTILGIGTDPIP